VSEALLEEPDFLKKLHRIREELSRESREQAFEELRAIRMKLKKRLGHLYTSSD